MRTELGEPQRVLILGSKTFTSPLIQAPLAGVSTAAFREKIWAFGGVGYCTTEMISAKTLLSKNIPKRYIFKSPLEGALSFQLSGHDPQELAQAALKAVDLGADMVDLNCGCPVDKIRKKQAGSAWLSQPARLQQAIEAMKSKIGATPLSIKIRVDGDSPDRFNAEIVQAACEGGVDFIIVHGRHWTEHYEQPVRLDQIAEIVQRAHSFHIPVIGNGDVKDYPSFKTMMRHTGCRGVMIGRASVGRPWLFAQLCAEDRGEVYQIPSSYQIGQLFLSHIERLIALDLEPEPIAVLQARSLAKYYLRAAGISKESHLAPFLQVSTLKAFEREVREGFL